MVREEWNLQQVPDVVSSCETAFCQAPGIIEICYQLLPSLMPRDESVSFKTEQNIHVMLDLHYERQIKLECEFLCLGKRVSAGLLRGGTCH